MIGTRILNYKITKKIGQGGMATVYEAKHITFDDRKVAIKVLDPILSKNIDVSSRFKNEAKIMASINHQNIVKVIDFESENGILAIIMELLEGQNLSNIIEQKQLSYEQKINIFKQILLAIDYGHQRNIIHRDIKPSNVFLTNNNTTAKILDFGIAKLLDSNNQKTATGLTMGTPMFMSPEQVKGKRDINQKSDIYSLGVLLYYMISEKTPYKNSDSQYDILTSIVNNPLPELKNEDQINSIIKKATTKNRDERYLNCKEFLNALDNNNKLSGFISINKDFLESEQNKKSKEKLRQEEEKKLKEKIRQEEQKKKQEEEIRREKQKKKQEENEKTEQRKIYKVKQTETPKLRPKKKKRNNKWLWIFPLLLIAFTLFFINKKYNIITKNNWSESYGGTKNDEVFTVLADDNGIFVGGLTKSFGKSMDWYFLEANYSGKEIWQKNIDGFNRGDAVHKIIKTNDNNYLAVGGAYKDDTYKSQNRIMKFDKKGNVIWNKFYGYYGWDEAVDVTQADDNSFILIFTDDTEDNTRCGIFKVDKNGNLVWEICNGDYGDYSPRDILKLNDNEYMICGKISYSDKTTKAFFTKIDSRGNVIFNKIIGDKGKSLTANSMTLAKWKRIIVVGFADNNEGNENDVWIAKIKPDGELVTNIYIAESQSQAALSVTNANDDNYILAGYTSTYENNTDGLIIKFTDDLNVIWRKTYGKNYNDKFNAITTTKKNIIATGYTTSENGDKNVWIVKEKN